MHWPNVFAVLLLRLRGTKGVLLMAKIVLEAAGLRLSYGERQLLRIDQLRIYDTDRIGLIGENGAGKTTLLRILAGEKQPEAGTVRRFVPTAVIHQEGTSGPGEDPELRARFRAQESRESLSGGEMTRNRISEALSGHPELLMADEPTTDLDEAGIDLLYQQLEAFSGSLILISHDRALLRHFCDRIWQLEDGEITDFPGGYDAFQEFAANHPRLFIKRAVSWGGEGAYISDVSSLTKMQTEWAKLDSNCVIEEYLENCASIKRLYPGCLNTIKVVTLWINGKAEIQTAMFRMGNNTEVDNVHMGGLCALVDIDSGVVVTKALDNRFRQYVFHPISGEQIIGFVIPMWDEVKDLAIKAAAVTPEMRYSSWDIAVTENGPVLIEGNWDAEFYPEQMLMQRGVRTEYCRKLKQ